MGLVVNGVRYDAKAQPFIGDLRLLKKEFGFGWGTVARRLQSLNESESDPLDLLDDDEFLDALLAWMWMSRLRAGERDCTLDQVRQTPIDSIQFEDDEDPTAAEDAADDPTSAPTGSGRGEKSAAVTRLRPTSGSTKTSSRRSTAG